MKTTIAILITIISLNLNSQELFASDNFIEEDKQYHMVFGALAAVPGYYMGWELSNGNRSTAIWVGIALGTCVNVGKELTDIGKTGFSMEDVAFGAIGAALSTLATDLIFQSKGSQQRRADRKLEAEKKRLDKIYAE
jgi:hypothetical protein